MVSSRWQKQNSSRSNIAFWVLLLSIMAIGFPAALFRLEGGTAVIASIMGLVAGFVLAFALLKRQANSMVRVLKFNYKEIERFFRILFKDNHIHFHRKTEEDAYRYDFPGRNELSMTIQPYMLLNLGFKDQDGSVLPATKITLSELSAENEAFAEKLAHLIDEMANKIPELSKKV